MSTVTTDVEITMDDVRAAQSGEIWATELVLGAMEDSVRGVAYREAARVAGADRYSTMGEFVQTARVAMWEALSRFDSSAAEVDNFRAFMFSTARAAITEHAMDMRHPGADRDAIKSFAYWVKQTDGDLDLACAMAQRLPDGYGRKLGKDRAHAARLAWMTTASLDAPDPTASVHAEEPVSYADMLVSTYGIPDELVTEADRNHADRSVRCEMVHGVLDAMGDGASKVLSMTFGIDPHGEFGVSANEEIGALLGKTAKQVIDARTKGYRQFAKRFIPLVSAGDEGVAAEWEAAFQAERDRSNVSSGKRARNAA